MNRRDERPPGRDALASVLAIAVALLPNVTCPACWPAYAGLVSALGVPVLLNRAVMVPLTVLFVVVAVGLMGFRAKRRRGYGPFLLGLLAAFTIVAGKFVLSLPIATYAGIGVLIVASVWNSRPTGRRPMSLCSECQEPSRLWQVELGEINEECP